jgi:hypothetical protein
MTTWDLYCAIHLAGELTVLGPKCHTAVCAEVVAARVHWPSRPIEVCERCANNWRHLASVGFGMHLAVEPVRYTPVGPLAPDDTEQRMRLLELN